jgi:hypothetical protein
VLEGYAFPCGHRGGQIAAPRLTSVNARTGHGSDFDRMKRHAAAGVLLLVCAVTGQSIDTRVRYEPGDLARVTAAKLRLRCPHCHKYHLFSFADAKLRPIRRGETVA